MIEARGYANVTTQKAHLHNRKIDITSVGAVFTRFFFFKTFATFYLLFTTKVDRKDLFLLLPMPPSSLVVIDYFRKKGARFLIHSRRCRRIAKKEEKEAEEEELYSE